jgi:hypothetical protein
MELVTKFLGTISLIDICGLHYKSFTILIYDHNEIGQYYKTMITDKASFG